ncbi:hypothetical protein DACRYDRAFT_22521 [Dacryopinax primogenitus]|uniref:Zn(2)-C6 fungal-type domain-containing protein n=1 Tax=Dacryopinax primogenitus (strain DJM 731) TaxID=1858805 RepID=M5FXW9_DACPD|nr:uncharacterized protein DACRYDRAFT_22521 [Dacryopinax primogenitus]EJU01364.1 hypothetical protein DACRYDRAFT_22521 [Dacryopinax primogenitus]
MQLAGTDIYAQQYGQFQPGLYMSPQQQTPQSQQSTPQQQQQQQHSLSPQQSMQLSPQQVLHQQQQQQLQQHQQQQQRDGIADSPERDDDEDSNSPKKKLKKDGTLKRKKVGHACLYCRRSHMTCDEGRPCQRCIKREIGHLCHDDPKATLSTNGKQSQSDTPPASAVTTTSQAAGPIFPGPPPLDMSAVGGSSGIIGQQPFINGLGTMVQQNNPWDFMQGGNMFASETLGSEFNVLSDFLETLDDRTFFTNTPTLPSLGSLGQGGATTTPLDSARPTASPTRAQSHADLGGYGVGAELIPQSATSTTGVNFHHHQSQQTPVVDGISPQPQHASTSEQQAKVELLAAIPGATKDERYLLTAADQEPGTRDERLARVIRAKYEAGLLRPFNYVVGYQRLTRWMEKHVSPESKTAIQQALSSFRPAFRAIAQGLRDIDLVFIEEAFERLLLDYDRVFSVMGVPACLWRRTGEIYKGNKEFADLVGLPHELMREGRLCIYELMAEESSVNYWEKYGQIAFDLAQKAVLTTCVLRYKPNLSAAGNTRPPTSIGKRKRDRDRERARELREEQPKQERFINCCFSFTIRRDLYGIPVMVVGNFLKC